MRSLILAIVAGLAVGCGPPSVDIPKGNDQLTSEAPPTELPAPTVETVPAKYPFRNLALRGMAGNAARVIVEGAGNPVIAAVQPVSGKFCVVVPLTTAPADYTLTVRSQSSDGKLSSPTDITVTRKEDAPAPTDAQLCDGSPADS